MAKTAFKGNPVETSGSLPKIGEVAPEFKLVNSSLEEVNCKL